ncbi:MAG: hypothetical protein ABIP94_23980 [Planctomycetota bacterium]
MNRTFFALALASLASPAMAQNCFLGNLGVSLGAGPDVVFGIRSIGFAFPLAGTTYADIHVCDKGYVYLSNASVPAPGFADFTPTAAELASGPPRICALWSDIQVLTGNNGECFLDSTPVRCTITWKNAQIYNSGAAGGPVFDMQMTLLPTGEIKCVYGPGTTNNSIAGQPTWQVGVAGVSPGGVALPAPSNLSANGTTTDNTLFEQWLAPGTFDMASTGLQMIPTNPGWVFVSTSLASCAKTENYGMGCLAAVGSPNSFYEFWAMSAFDLNNTTLTMLRTGASYTVLNSLPGTIVPPTGGAQTVATGLLDGQQLFTLASPMPVPGGSTTVVNITTKGQIEIGGANGVIDFTPTAAELLANPRTVFACWHDYNQTSAGSGIITFEEIGGFAYATWSGVHSFSTTTPNTFQFQLNLGTGDVKLVIGQMSGAASIDNIVVGYSYAGASADPGPTDLSSAFGALTVFDDTLPLALRTNGNPSLGNAAFALVTSNVPPLVPIAFVFVGDLQVNPGLNLTFIGMNGCFGYTNANLGSATFPVSPTTWSGSQALPIPNNAMLVGTVLTCQSVAFSLATPLNLVASNGTKLTLGF